MSDTTIPAPEKAEKNTDFRPDFRGITGWIFDLDHTLYTMDAAQQAEMEERICRYVQRHFGIARDPAWEIQKTFLREHGSTFAGLLKNERIDPDAYHDAVNDVEALSLRENVALRAGLERLPGKRFVFTNNCGRFARDVIARLGVADLFDGIVDVRALNFVSKPKPAAYDAMLAFTGIEPAKAAMFDDSPRNLVPARALGVKTVWFNDGLGQSTARIDNPHLHIDYQTDDLANFLQTIRI